MNTGQIARVAVSVATYMIDRPYDYRVPIELKDSVVPGMRVVVPFGRGNAKEEGIVLSVTDKSERSQLKCIHSLLDDEPVLTQEQISLALWLHERFFCTVYEAVRAMLPSGIWFKDGKRRVGDKTENYLTLAVSSEDAAQFAAKSVRSAMQRSVVKLLADFGTVSEREACELTGASAAVIRNLVKAGIISREPREAFRRPDYGYVEPAEDFVLNEEQQAAYNGLTGQLDTKKAQASLLYGVTGSGKTAVYIKLIARAISQGRRAIVLLPEISLTPQLVRIFMSHFGDGVAVLHSSLSIGERYDEWKRIRSGLVNVVVGTRSAIFAPVTDLGLIIIDEEQEGTYKSENNPRYHARDVAKYRCAKSEALLLLGSATPSVESMYWAKQGTYKLYKLASRFNEQALPHVMIADMRKEVRSGNVGTIGSVLYGEIESNIKNGEQTILFLNRRGTQGLVVCAACGSTLSCPNCSVSLTYHAANSRLVCHYCGHSVTRPKACPECGGELIYSNPGTEQVERELKELFPDTSVIRMDADTVSAAHSHEKILDRFRNEKIPILVGTQMVTKGLDFPNVTLVGVLSADQSMYANDYRAQERAFSLITQVVGRSGRGEKPGRAVIQTFSPNSELIRLAAVQDYDGFYEREIALRTAGERPPLKDIFRLTVSGPDETDVLWACKRIKDSLVILLEGRPDAVILGPAPASLMKYMNRYRYCVTVCCRSDKAMRNTVMAVLRDFSADKQNRSMALYADYNPLD